MFSRFCLKFFVRRICSYCRYGSLRKTFCVPGNSTTVTFFLIQKVFSCPFVECMEFLGQFLLESFFFQGRKSILEEPINIFIIDFCTKFIFLSLKFASVLCASLSLVWLLLSSLPGILIAFLPYKRSISIIFRAFLADVLACYRNIYRFLELWLLGWEICLFYILICQFPLSSVQKNSWLRIRSRLLGSIW